MIKKSIKKSEITNLIGKAKMDKPIGKIFSIGKGKKGETKEVTGSGSAGGYSAPLFTTSKKEMTEKWSQKYKESIDCDNPKGFSQKAHCQGKKKKETKEATGASSSGAFVAPVGFNKQSKFVKDSFKETPKKTETKEATGASSAGSYVTTAAWAKSLNKKDWGSKDKGPLFKGGKFVQVKKKCKTFPYCNQGDINALNLTTESNIENIVTKLSKKYNVSEEYINKLIIKEYRKGKL